MRIPKAYQHMVEEYYQEPYNCVINLKPGYIYLGEMHSVMEDTWKQAIAGLAEVEPCDCAECQRLMNKH